MGSGYTVHGGMQQLEGKKTEVNARTRALSRGLRSVYRLRTASFLHDYMPANGGYTTMIRVQDTVAYDLPELSSMLGVSTRTLRNYIRSGKLQAFKLGRRYYVTQRALDAYFDTPSSEWEWLG